LIKLDSNITPYTITRIASDYNSTKISSNICSATAIRKALSKNNDISLIKNVVSKFTYDIIDEKIFSEFNPIFDENYFEILSNIILRDSDKLNTYFEVNEGIENKIYQNVFNATSLNDLATKVKSKRYTHTKIKRTLNNILLGISKEDMSKVKNIKTMPYIRILAFNDKGRKIIKTIKNNSQINIINKFSNVSFIDDEISKIMINYDIKSTNLYNAIYFKNNKDLLKGPMDYYTAPIYVKGK
jgi:predicted nucleotidyltransferase